MAIVDLYSLWIVTFYISVALILLVSTFLIIHLWKLRARTNKRRAILFTAIICLAAVCGSFAFILGATNITSMEWRWSNEQNVVYSVQLRVNATGRFEVIVPVPENESVLSGLALTSGSAQHEIIDTIHGRGLRIDNASGNVTLESTKLVYGSLGNLSLSTAVENSTLSSFHDLLAWFYFASSDGMPSVNLSFSRIYSGVDWLETMQIAATLYP